VVVALASGVFFAFFVTLLMVPSLYGIGLDIGEFFAGARKWIGRKIRPGAQADPETTVP